MAAAKHVHDKSAAVRDDPMRLGRDGAQLFSAAFAPPWIDALERLLGTIPDGRPGIRLAPIAGLAEAVRPASAIAAAVLGPDARPVRATFFDKAPGRNWALGWHQDRTIAVAQRRDAPGFADWTVKGGVVHVVPPFDILARMLTLRIHLDPVGADNAPLLVSRGSHRRGRIAEPAIAAVVAAGEIAACPAARGDTWIYATPILHASARAERPSRRRVLQILYSADDLPAGLAWPGL